MGTFRSLKSSYVASSQVGGLTSSPGSRQRLRTCQAAVLLVGAFVTTSVAVLAGGVPPEPPHRLPFVSAIGIGPPLGSVTPIGAWVEAHPAEEPSEAAAMAFSPELSGVLLYAAGETANRMWVYDSQLDNWSVRASSGPLPERRLGSDLVYDGATGKMVLFGGLTGGANFTAVLAETNETWVYDALNNTWENVTSTGSPPPRFAHHMTYDAAAQRIVLFGGEQFGCHGFCIPEIPPVYLNDTWLFDGRNNTWTNVTRPSSPPARAGHGLAYDPVARKVVLFGGTSESGYGSGILYGDTWLRDASVGEWTRAAISSPSPVHRSAVAMAYDASAGAIVLFGGLSTSDLNDTWWYRASDNSWTLVGSPLSPPPRHSAGIAFDFASDLVVLHGGVSNMAGWTDTWVYHVISAPLASSMQVTPLTGTTPLNVSLHGEAAGGLPPYAFHWEFGEGVPSQSQNTYHLYASPGNFTVTLTVRDTGGQNLSTHRWVIVAAPPEQTILGMPTWAFYGLVAVTVATIVTIAIWRRRLCLPPRKPRTGPLP